MTETSPDIRIVLINGSARPGNYTGKVLAIARDELLAQDVTVDRVEPAHLSLPMPGVASDAPVLRDLHDRIAAADGVMLATPLYNGSYSSVIKLLIDNLGYPSALTGKPVALLGVAASPFGADAAIEHLQAVCVHVQANVLPDPLSIASVWESFDEHGACRQSEVEAAIRNLARQLAAYIEDFLRPLAAINDGDAT